MSTKDSQIPILILFMVCSTAQIIEGAHGSDPSDMEQTVEIIYIGDCFTRGVVPFLHLKDEPQFDLSPMPTWSPDLARSWRVYMPRTYKHHVEMYDVVIMSDAIRDTFKVEPLEWFRKGVIEGGQGFIMIGGIGSFGAGGGRPSWSGSPIEEALPCNILDNQFVQNKGPVHPVPVDMEHEFCVPLPWREVPPFEGFNIVEVKQGAVEILQPRIRIGEAPGTLLASWQVGKGVGVAHTPDLTIAWVGHFRYWEYYGDYCINLVYMLAQLGVPQEDLSIIHEARVAMRGYSQERNMLIAMIEFVDRFGADIRQIDEGLVEIMEIKAEANAFYIERDYVSAIGKLDEIRRRVGSLREEAFELKDAALLWVFIAEWFIVTATFMITGYAIWSLMVRRRLYKQVQVTRLITKY